MGKSRNICHRKRPANLAILLKDKYGNRILQVLKMHISQTVNTSRKFLAVNTLISQNIIIAYLITCWSPFCPQNNCNVHWHGSHKCLVDGWRQIFPDDQAALTQILDIPIWYVLSSKLSFHDTSNVLHLIKIQ